MSDFPLDAEQVVRLTAAVLWELKQPAGDDRPDALLLRLADAVGLPLATEPAARSVDPRIAPPRSGPRGETRTQGLQVQPYPADVRARSISSFAPASPGQCDEA